MSRRNFSQPSLADAFVKAYSRPGGFLEDIAKTFEWSAFDVILRPLHSSSDGAPAYPPLTMFKIVLLQQWYGLSDPAAEEAVRDRLSFRRFCGVPLDEETPDHSSIWRFRQRLAKLGLDEKLLYPSGKRAYFVDYRNADGGRKRMTLGRHGVITCEEARKLAMQTLGGVALSGDDPLTERQTRRSSLTVAELCADYLKAAEKGLIMGKGGRAKKASTFATDRGRVQRHIVPLLGKRLVRDLTRADVAKFIRDVTAGKTAVVEKTKLRGKAVVEGGRGAAARTAGLLGGILSFAASEGVIEHNPARGVKRPADGRRTRRLTPEEYRKLGDALRQAEEERETWQGVAGSRLLALTGCRLGEIVNLKWTEVDDAGGCFRLEDSKEGASTRPIGRPALDLLSGLEREDGAAYVLPAARGSGHFGGLSGAFDRLVERAGLENVTRHTMRHSFASVAGDLGFAESTISAMLGHAAGSVTSRYVHHLDAVLIAAADKVARAIDGYMTGASAKVVELPRRGRKAKA